MGKRGPKPHTWEICIEKIQNRSYLKEDTGCFIWMGRTAGQLGYGYMRCDSRDYYIHRLVYERMICEELPDIVRHTCDTPRCWNPEHLRGGTQVDNIQDGIQKGRIPQCIPASTRSRDRLIENRFGVHNVVAHHCPFCGSLTDRPVIFAALKQRIFTYIWDNPGCTAKEIEAAVYGQRRPNNSNAMSVHLSKIRERLTYTAYQMISVPAKQTGLTGRVVGYKITYKPKDKTNGTTNITPILP